MGVPLGKAMFLAMDLRHLEGGGAYAVGLECVGGEAITALSPRASLVEWPCIRFEVCF